MKRKQIQCKETGEIYRSIQAMGEALNLTAGYISRCLKRNGRLNDKHYTVIEESRTNAGNSRAVRCIESGEAYESISEAARKHYISKGSLANHLKGITNTCCGKHWEYVDKG